jgi:ABC-type branched-subunit amino acid transport system permease subunit
MLLFGLALVLMMLFRPSGIWPARRRTSAAGGVGEKSRAAG